MIVTLLFAALAFGQEAEAPFGPQPAPAPIAEVVVTEAEQRLYDRLLSPPVREETSKAVVAAPSQSSGWEGVAMGLGIAIVGAMGVLLWRRRNGVGETPAPALQVLARCQLDASSGLAVISFDGHRMIIGTGSSPPALLADFGPSALHEMITTPIVSQPQPPVAPVDEFEHRLDAAQLLVEQVLRRREVS